MNCNQARRLLSASLDKDTTFEEQSNLEQHLEACHDCTAEMEKLTSICGFLRSMPETDPGDNFLAQVQDQIRNAEPVMAPLPEAEGSSWLDGIREFFSIAWVRPALGGAVGLLAGLLINFGGAVNTTAPNMVPMIAENETPMEVGGYVRHIADSGPFSEIDLPSLDSLNDSLEYVLDPYVQDPARGLVPMGNSDVHQVNADGNTQRGVKIYR
jgi:Putative zinc-finger